MRTRPTPQEHDILDDKEFARIKEILDDAESSTRLTEWEEDFCDSIRDRIAEYQNHARISDKQWEVLERIEGKMYGI